MAVRDFSALTNVYVKSGKFEFETTGTADIAGSKFTSVDSGIKVIETKYGYLTATKADGVYDFTALSGGEFQFADAEDASVGTFDGSGVAYGIKVSVDNEGNTKALKSVLTGYGKDEVIVDSVEGGNFDLGAGKDTISFKNKSTATVSLGEGADLISVKGSEVSSITVSDYNYADGDKISVTDVDVDVLDFDFANGVATVGKSGTASVVATTTLNNGVYELDLNDKVFVRTGESSVNYVATEAINFVSNGDTTTLDLKLAGAGNKTNIVSVGATEGTVNIIAGKAMASITVGAGVDFSLGIEKKGASVSVTNVLDADDTLYLMDGGKISDVEFNANGALEYGNASVAGAYDNAKEGTFKYNINGVEGVLAYGNNGTVTYADGVTYYANAATVDASEYEGELILNLNGVCGDAFNDNVSVVSGVVSGLVAGRDKEDTIINLATEEGNKTEVYGGAKGNDSINLNGVEEDSTNVIWYSNGDGNDTVYGFTKGDNTVYFHDAAAAAGVLNDVASMVGNDLKIAMDKKNALTLYGVKATVAGETNVVNFKDVAGNTFKVAVGDGADVTYNSEVNIYKGATTLKVDGEEDRIIWTGASNDEYGYYDDIKAIDASDASGTLYLSGTNVSGMSITGGTGVNHMWGGGNKVQTMVGNDDAVDVFWFGTGDGRDVATDASADDGVNLYNVEKIDEVAIKTSSNYFTVTIGNDSLKVDLVAGTTAEDALKTFTFADKAGALYTYDTESKKFQQK